MTAFGDAQRAGVETTRLAFVGGPALWPINGGVGLFRAPYRRTLAKLEFLGKPGVVRREYPSMAAAIDGVTAEHSLADDRVRFLAGTGDDAWTAVFVSNFPLTDVTGYWLARARLEVHCDYLSYQWIPTGSPAVPATDRPQGCASFLDYRYVRRLLGGRPDPADKRSIQTSEQGARWDFDMVGPARPYEEPEHYDRRRKADRLPLDVIESYLAACGIPVGRTDWLTGPVTAAIEPGRGAHRDWKTLADLRAVLGYPPDGIPSSLTQRRAHD